MGLKVTVQVDTSVPGGGRLRIVNQAVTGPPGPQGDPGPTGPQGPAGTAATIAVGTVTTVNPGDPATVTNSGTSSAAVFDFDIPQGDPGQGVPAHGTTGQILAKINNQSYNTQWVDPTPTDAQYVTLATNGTLTNERVLTAGTGITVNDGGAGAAVTVATTAILPTVVDAKGDLIVGTAADTVARLAVGGTNGHVLKVDSGTSSGLLWEGQAEAIIVAISDETTAITTGTNKVKFRMPFAMTLTAVRASLSTASSSGLPTFDINEAGNSILSTKITIDVNETTSTTAATPPVISDTALADDAEISIDIDVAGTGAKGAKVYLIGRRA